VTKQQAKKELLYALADLLEKDDDLIPGDVDPESREYDTWDAARSELSIELRRRSGGIVHRGMRLR